MKLLLTVACIAVGSTSLQAELSAGRAPNPKTRARPYSSPGTLASRAGTGAARPKSVLLLQQKRAAASLPGSTPGQPHGMQLVPGDDCASPLAISGIGTFNYDCSMTTTGAEGQNEAICISPGIDQDSWFSWTAPLSGNATMTLCGSGTQMDSKIAAYPGPGCPVNGSALACNDDACSTESRILFPVSAGNSYLLQVGCFPGSGGSLGIFTLSIAPGPANDECSGATPIAGTGTFSFSNIGASTSPQQGLACGFGYCNSDVWFDWTASATGLATCSLCTVSFDTLAAAYAGASCPGAGTALGCDDDTCGPLQLQSSLAFPCVGGNHYLLQLGAYATGVGSGSFSINISPPPPNDNCATPTPLGTAVGTFPFSLLGASTGTQGQQEPACNLQGQTGIDGDVWFSWTAPSSTRARLSLCGGPAFDSKVAIYQGPLCPLPGTAITCNDDACGLASDVCFDITAGQAYLFQIGVSPGTPQATGSFDLSLKHVQPPCTYDDASSESLLGLSGGGDMVWLQRFGSAGSSTIVSSIQVAWGSPAMPGTSPGNGTPTDVFLWKDGATQDGDPSDATLLWSSATSVSNVDTDTFNTISMAPIQVTGIFFVGSHLQHLAWQAAAPMDQHCPSARVSWFFGAPTGQTVDFAHPGANPVPPQSFDQAGTPANLMLRAGCSFGPVIYVCDPGFGGVLACPCSNPPSGLARGCNNLSATGGASLSASGSNSLATPTLSFVTAGENPAVASIMLQGTALSAGSVFGHGVRCAGGSILRLYAKVAVAGSVTMPSLPADPSIPARSAALGGPILAGQKRWYMVYYRDTTVALPGCPALNTRFNGTNGAETTWLP